MEKTLLVIGASSDMGVATIRAVKEEYMCIIAHYFHMNEKLEALQLELGKRMVCLQADLSNIEEVEKLIKTIRELGLQPSHIVHFPAPTFNNSRFHKLRWEVFQRQMDVSLKSLVIILQAFLPNMLKQQYGKVVIMLSVVVNNVPPAHISDYVVTKYALLGLVKALATEYADKGITVNGISPAMVQTKYIANQPEVIIEQRAQASPIGRNLVPEDVIPSIIYLLSDGADCINGQNISITCGR